jgi:transposase
MKAQKKYSPEMKAEAIKMVLEQGLTHEETGRRLTIPKGSIGHWVATAKTAGTGSKPGERSAAELANENSRLRKELNEARMEREILKKATAYFAKESLPGTRS